MSRIMPMMYIAIAKGSPCVVPSREDKISPLIYKLMSFLYVMINVLASEGHSNMNQKNY